MSPSSNGSERFISLSQTGPVARITLDGPARNALSLDMQRELRAALATLATDPSVRALLITGANGAFCSGAALDAFPQDEGHTLGQTVSGVMDDLCNPLIRDIRDFPHPVVALVTGAAAGAGASLALAADVTLATPDGFFVFPFAPKLGLIPDLGATWAMTQRLGEARAMGLALMGGRLSAERAASWGLIWDCVPQDRAEEEAGLLCAQLSEAPPSVVRSLREAFGRAHLAALSDQLDFEAQHQSHLLDTPAFDEGRRAFLEKRAPRFHGA